MYITLQQARDLADKVLETNGVSGENRAILSELIVKAESEGSRSHGLMRLLDYVASIRAGWLNPSAYPIVRDAGDVFVTADCQNGFTQVAAVLARDRLLEKSRRSGIAVLTVRNGHHIGALWLDVEPFAIQGMIALNFVNSRCRIAPYGSRNKLLGTNAMAFSTPDGRDGAVTWDQASSVMSLGDIKLYACAGKPLPSGIGLDSVGNATNDAVAVLNGGALLPFGAHKGASIAMMVEIMAAALTGANFGFQDDSPGFPGAASSNAGQFILVINPQSFVGDTFAPRIAELFEHLRDNDAVRLPGDRRSEKRRLAMEEGLPLPDAEYKSLMDCIRRGTDA